MILRIVENEHIVDNLLNPSLDADGHLLSPFENDQYPASLRYRFGKAITKSFQDHIEKALSESRQPTRESLLEAISESQSLLRHF